jgi:hypothetical protein
MTDQAEARGDAGQIRPPISAGVRVLVTSVMGLFAFGVVMTLAPWQVASLVGWDVWAGVFIG